jgi:hypothetical protein
VSQNPVFSILRRIVVSKLKKSIASLLVTVWNDSSANHGKGTGAISTLRHPLNVKASYRSQYP